MERPRALQARGQVRLAAEGANGPCSPAGEEVLKKRGIEVLPDVIVNAGGVTVSYYVGAEPPQRNLDAARGRHAARRRNARRVPADDGLCARVRLRLPARVLRGGAAAVG